MAQWSSRPRWCGRERPAPRTCSSSPRLVPIKGGGGKRCGPLVLVFGVEDLRSCYRQPGPPKLAVSRSKLKPRPFFRRVWVRIVLSEVQRIAVLPTPLELPWTIGSVSFGAHLSEPPPRGPPTVS